MQVPFLSKTILKSDRPTSIITKLMQLNPINHIFVYLKQLYFLSKNQIGSSKDDLISISFSSILMNIEGHHFSNINAFFCYFGFELNFCNTDIRGNHRSFRIYLIF